MPGIFGLTREFNCTDKCVRESVTELSYSPHYIFDEFFKDDSIICQRTHLGVIGEKKSPQNIRDELYCWVEGEIYNQDEIKVSFNLQSSSLGNTLLEAYSRGNFRDLLKKIDGCFTAVVYDKKEKTIQFVSDRFGLKPLYIWQTQNKIAWSSELKGFLKLPFFEKKINPLAVECFLDCGQLIGDISWFKEVHLLSASTLSVYDLDDKIYKEERYWNWSEIKPQTISFEEATFRAGELLKKAVNKRICHSKLSISLSGGLDSRAIAGSLGTIDNIHAITFGKKNTDECLFARKVANAKGLPHTIFHLDENNWLRQRVEGIWKMEGSISIEHLHASFYHEEMAKIACISLNGFAGDLVLGGSWINNPDQKTSNQLAKKYFGNSFNLQPLDIPYYDLNKEDPYFIDTRVRRFTNMGIEEVGKLIEHRRPFMDIDLIDFVYSLPDHFRLNNKLYFAIYKYCFPKKFSSIPWANNGLPLNRKKYFWYLGRRTLKRVQRKLGFGDRIQYTDYNQWTNEYLKIFKEITNPEIAIYPKYLNQSKTNAIFSFFNNRNQEMIFRVVTLEIWLQQVFNGRLKNSKSLLRIKNSDYKT